MSASRWSGIASAKPNPKRSVATKAQPGPPLPEDHRGQGDVPAPAGHVLGEPAGESDREERATERRQHAGGDDRGVAHPEDGDPDGVGRARMLADGADAQPDRRLEEDHEGEDDGTRT